MNPLSVRTFGESGLVLLDGLRVALLVRIDLSHQRVQLEGVLVERLESLNGLNRSILVDARKLVERVRVFGIFSNQPVQL